MKKNSHRTLSSVVIVHCTTFSHTYHPAKKHPWSFGDGGIHSAFIVSPTWMLGGTKWYHRTSITSTIGRNDSNCKRFHTRERNSKVLNIEETWGASALFLELHHISEFRALYFRMPVRQSGLQRDVLKLYRDLHRAAKKKDPDNSHNFTAFGEISSWLLWDLFWILQSVYAMALFYLAFTIKHSAVMKEFRIKAASVTRTDFKTIEHLLRYGYKQKKLIEMPGFRSGSVTSSS